MPTPHEPREETIAGVYAAAAAAAANVRAAEEATARAFGAAITGPLDPERVAATAVRLVLHIAPAPTYARMDARDAEAVALCRLLRLDVNSVAALLGVAAPEIRRRLTRGLRTALAEPACSV